MARGGEFPRLMFSYECKPCQLIRAGFAPPRSLLKVELAECNCRLKCLSIAGEESNNSAIV